MSILQNLKQMTYSFLRDTQIKDAEQAFLLGTVCGYFLQHKQQDSIEIIKEQLKSMKQLINTQLISSRAFDQVVGTLVSNLEAPKPYDFQNGGGTPVLDGFQVEEENEDATLALIKQLQEEDNRTQQKLKKQLEDEQQVDCPICITPLMDDDIYPLEFCVHLFHKECVKEYMMQAIADRRQFIICPDNTCKKEMGTSDMMTLVGKDKYEDYQKYMLQQYVDNNATDMSWCPTPDCNYAFVFNGEEDKELNCPTCKKHYCLGCRVPFHKGQSCKEFQITNTRDSNDVKFEKFVKGHKFKMCSKCKFWVEKNQGCNHMTCRCGYQFCYACGGKYMQCECVEKQRLEMERQRQLILDRQQQQQNRKRGSKKR